MIELPDLLFVCYFQGDTDTTVVIFMALALNRVDFLKSFRDSLIYKAFEEFTEKELVFLYWYRTFGCPEIERTGVLKHFVKEVIWDKKWNKEKKKKKKKEEEENDSESVSESSLIKDDNHVEIVNVFGSPNVEFFCDITGIFEIRYVVNMKRVNNIMELLDEAMFQHNSSIIQVKFLTDTL